MRLLSQGKGDFQSQKRGFVVVTLRCHKWRILEKQWTKGHKTKNMLRNPKFGHSSWKLTA